LPSRVKSNHVATQEFICRTSRFRDGLCNPRHHPRLHFELGDGEKRLSLLRAERLGSAVRVIVFGLLFALQRLCPWRGRAEIR
jgi:hypothetical protein